MALAIGAPTTASGLPYLGWSRCVLEVSCFGAIVPEDACVVYGEQDGCIYTGDGIKRCIGKITGQSADYDTVE